MNLPERERRRQVSREQSITPLASSQRDLASGKDGARLWCRVLVGKSTPLDSNPVLIGAPYRVLVETARC